MKEGHIYIQGIISPWQDNMAAEWGEVNTKQVTQQIQANQDAEKLVVHIHSPGGDVTEGFAIHDLLVASDKEIETRIEGLCASIATVIALAGSTRLMTENSEFMIHNPFIDYIGGDADDIQKVADQMKEIETKIINFYSKKTGSSAADLDQWMKEETWLNADQAKDLGFITEVITTMKAVATFKIKNSNDNIMNKKELETTIDSKLDSFMDKIKNLFKSNNALNVTVTAGDGTVFDFGSQAETTEDIAVGMTATIEGGGVPDGEYAMPDGRTWVFDNGELTAMNEAPAEDEEMKALKAENEQLKADLEAAKTQNAENTAAVETIKTEMKALKAELKSDLKTFDPEPRRSGEGGDQGNRASGLKPKLGM